MNVALATANLINLGRSPADAVERATRWAQRQEEQSIEHVATLARQSEVEDQLPVGGTAHRLYGSFHYSLYPLLYRALARRNPRNVVYSLIGEQDYQHREALNRLAGGFGFCIEFIESGSRMVRALRNAISQGHAAVLLIDIPWSKQESELDASYPVPGGCFRGRKSLERLMKLVDAECMFACAERNSDTVQKVTLRPLGQPDIGAAFAGFGALLQNRPEDYERLHQMHKFFDFDRPGDVALTFGAADDTYVIHTRSMKAWRVSTPLLVGPGTVSADSSVRARARAIVNEEVDHVVCV